VKEFSHSNAWNGEKREVNLFNLEPGSVFGLCYGRYGQIFDNSSQFRLIEFFMEPVGVNSNAGLPLWMVFDPTAWENFKIHFAAYKLRGGDKHMRDAVSSDVLLMIKLYSGRENMADITDEDLAKAVNKLFGPRDKSEALHLLESVKLEEKSIKGLGKFCMEFLKTHKAIAGVQVSQAVQARYFVRALKWDYVRRAVEAEDPQTVEAAIAAATKAAVAAPTEVARAPAGQQAVGGLPRTPKKNNGDGGSVGGGAAKTPQHEGGRPAKSRSQEGCWKCGALDHYQNDPKCPKFEPRTRQQVAASRGSQAKSISSKSCPRIEVVTCGGTVLRVLLDSGASVNVISPALAARLIELGCPSRERHQTLEGVAGAILESTRELDLELRLERGVEQPINFRATVAVGDTGEEMLIGWPLIDEIGVEIMFGAAKATVAGASAVVTRVVASPEEHVVDYDNIMIDDPEFRREADKLLDRFAEVFEPIDAQGASVPPFEIKLKPGATLKSKPPRRLSPALAAASRAQTQELLDAGFVVPSISPVACPIVMAEKKNGEWRMCSDYGQVNDATEDIQFPLQHMMTALGRVQGKTRYSTFDLTSGFRQIRMAEGSRYLTAFVTPDGLYECTTMPFGLKNAPKYFMKCMMDALGPLVGVACEVFIDDILVYGASNEELLANMEKVLGRLRDARLRLNRDKCRVGMTQVEYLGHIINEGGISLSSERKRALIEMTAPKTTRQVRAFLGFANYFRPFIRDYAMITKPLSRLCSVKVPFEWGPDQQRAFAEVKRLALEIPFLAHVDYSKQLVLRTDASNLGIGGALVQVAEDGSERLVALISKAFTETEAKWSTIEQECFAMFYCARKLEHTLRGHKFVFEIDNKNLQFINNSETPKVVRWRLALSEYDFEVRHIPGTQNVLADALSRIFAVRPVAPRELIRKYHNEVVGHMGVVRTEARMREHGEVWPTMRKDIVEFVASCAVCQKVRLGQGDMNEALHTTIVHAPFQSVSVDLIGPLPADDAGNKYVMTMVDDFSRFVELEPCRDPSAESGARCLVKLFARYGLFKELRTDPGSQFTANLVAKLMELLGVEHRFAPAQTPKAMGRVERTNQETMRHARALVFEVAKRARWSDCLPLVQRVINSTVKPAELMYAGVVDLDRQLFEQDPPAAERKSFGKYLSDLIGDQKRLVAASDAHQQKVVDTYLAKSPAEPTQFAVGDLVLISYPERAPSKLHSRWRGPYRVTAIAGNRYTCEDLRTQATKVYDITRLKKYINDPGRDPLEVAAVDADEFIVDKIVDHRGSLPKSKLEFRVRWAGYTDEDDTWEPYKNVKDLAALDAYARTHPELGL